MVYHEIIQAYQEATEVAENEYGIELANSTKALLQLEEILNQDIQTQKDTSQNEIDTDKRSRMWGAYLGETIRFVLGGYWLAEEEDMALSVFRRVISPASYIRERLSGAADQSVSGYYMELLAEIQGSLDGGTLDPA